MLTQSSGRCETTLSQFPLSPLCLCGYVGVQKVNHRDTEDSEEAQKQDPKRGTQSNRTL